MVEIFNYSWLLFVLFPFSLLFFPEPKRILTWYLIVFGVSYSIFSVLTGRTAFSLIGIPFWAEMVIISSGTVARLIAQFTDKGETESSSKETQ